MDSPSEEEEYGLDDVLFTHFIHYLERTIQLGRRTPEGLAYDLTDVAIMALAEFGILELDTSELGEGIEIE